jgi:O-acetylhomoserine (thiol)-lyase
MKEWEFQTRAIHAGIDPESAQGSTVTPIYESAAFAYDSAEELSEVFEGRRPGHVYSRISNPTVMAFEQRMNSLEDGAGALATSSGMAAITTTLLTLLNAGDVIAAGKSLFGGTLLLLRRVLSRFGIESRFFDPCSAQELEHALTANPKAIYVETIGNPKLDVPDFRVLSAAAKRRGIPLLVDSTLTTPFLFPAKRFGASVVVHSGTKYICGSGTAVGGAIVDLGTFDWSGYPNEGIREMTARRGVQLGFLAAARKNVLQNIGTCLSPFSASRHSQGLETLALRMDRHCSNALALAEFLTTHPRVSAVNYPGLASSAYRDRVREQFCGRGGGILTLRMGTRQGSFDFIRRLKLAKDLANVGDAKTLVIHPASTIYRDLSPAEMADAGVTDDLVRVSVGIESITDIIADFEQALN